MYKFIQFCLTITFLSTINIFPQEPPIEWGEVPLADLQMTSFPADSNATAVVLCDFGESKTNDDLEIVYYRHIRIKILNENGYEWGTHSIYLYTGKNGERLNDLEAITYSLDENGEIVENELDDDNIFEEEITDNRLKYTFTMPALKPGCIVDIQYKITAESLWYVRGWVFQHDEPVVWSEYRLIYPKNISFAVVTSGYESWAINEFSEIDQVFREPASLYVGKISNCNYCRWAVKDAPALRDEPYITTVNDYVNEVEVQLAGYAFYQLGLKQILTDWNTLSQELMDSENFGDVIDPGDVEDLTKNIVYGITSPEDKMKAIYNWVINSIVWNNEERVFADYNVDDVIEYKKGSSADITFLLISMLRSAGLEADPVILSTRPNGKVQEVYPIVSQFDYILARVKIGPESFFIDATDPLRPINILPEKVLNVRGMVVKEEKPEWVFLKSQISNLDKTVINVNLNTDGTLSANFQELFGEYKSLSLRRDNNGMNEIELAEKLYESESSGFMIDSASASGMDDIYSPVKIKADISSANYTQQGGDFIYFNPNMIHRLTDNPFKAKDRKFPIDYSYPRGKFVCTNISIPEGYELKEKYDNRNFTVGSYASYIRKVDVNNNIIQIICDMEIKQSEIRPENYKGLKEFYARIITAQSEMLVFGPVEKMDVTEDVSK